MSQWHGEYADIQRRIEEIVLSAAQEASQKWGVEFSLLDIDVEEEVVTEDWDVSESFYHIECKLSGTSSNQIVSFSVKLEVREDEDTGRDFGTEYDLVYPEIDAGDIYSVYEAAL